MRIEPLSVAELIRTQEALNQCNGNITEAAKLLGLPRSTVSHRIHKGALREIYEILNHSNQTPTKEYLKIFVLPDTQVKPGVDTTHIAAAGEYVAVKKPDVIVCIGDFADMESLSSYDRGKKSFEGRTYKADIASAKAAMKRVMTPIRNAQGAEPTWNPRLVLTLGNHENRIERAIELDRKLEGTIGIRDLEYEKFGWEVHPFLETVEIGGVMFSHYFVTGVMGRAATTASAILSKKHQSCVAGHLQGRQVAYAIRADGSQITTIIAGSFYSHEEKYLGAQGNKHWRGAIMLHEVNKGSFDEMFCSLHFLVDWYKRLLEERK